MKRVCCLLFALLSILVAFSDEASIPGNVKKLTTMDDKAFPYLKYGNSADGTARSPVDGRVVQAPNLPKEFGESLVVEQRQDYELYGKKRQVTYWIVLYNFQLSGNELQTVTKNQTIGKTNATGMKLAVCSDRLDDFFLLMSNQLPVYYAGRYWFLPSFMVSSSSTAYLSFRAIDDINKALLVVAKDATESGPGYVFYPGYKVRFSTKLSAYPRDLTDAERTNLRGYEMQYYGQTGVSKYATDMVVDGFKFLLCWQTGFDKYLKNEYVLGNQLWIFGGIVTYDAWNKVGYLFVRDFSLKPVEEMLQRNLKALGQ